MTEGDVDQVVVGACWPLVGHEVPRWKDEGEGGQWSDVSVCPSQEA